MESLSPESRKTFKKDHKTLQSKLLSSGEQIKISKRNFQFKNPPSFSYTSKQPITSKILRYRVNSDFNTPNY